MLFSVVIPLYNKNYAIKRCIESVLNQGKLLHEIIIVNDGSTDNSLKIVQENFQKEISSGLIILINKTNEGVSIARNLGIQHASKELICLLDADDEWLPGFLNTMSKLIDDFPEAHLYALAHKIKKGKDNTYIPKHGLHNKHRGYVENFFISSARGSVVKSSKICIKKQPFLKTGGFPEKINAGEDLHIWILMALQGKIACDMKYLTIVHQEMDSSRSARKISVPYPLIYYSENKITIKKRDLNYFLIIIFIKHFIYSLKKRKIKEAYLRLYYFLRIFI